MSTIYVFDAEVGSLVTAASGDKVLVSDVSAGTKKAITVGNLVDYIEGAANTFTGTQTFSGAVNLNGNTAVGNSSADTIGFYGATKITRPTSASQTAITAGATTTAHKVLTIALRKALKDLGLIKGSA